MMDRTISALLLSLAATAALSGCARDPGSDSRIVTAEVRKDALGVVAAYNAQDAQRAAAYDARGLEGKSPRSPPPNAPHEGEGLSAPRNPSHEGEGS